MKSDTIRTVCSTPFVQTPIVSTVCSTPIVRTPLVSSVCTTPLVQTPNAQTKCGTSFSTVKAYCRDISENHLRSMMEDSLSGLSVLTHRFATYQSECDKYDYAMAAFSGVVSSLIDSFFVQSPLYSPLGNITDQAIDNLVIKFSRWVYRLDEKQKRISRKEPNTIASAIGFLEDRFRTNYDARYGKDLIGGEQLKHFYPGNHHLKSLAHCPDIVGLFFSILDQLTDKTTVVNSVGIARLSSKATGISLGERDFVSKIIVGVARWIGHMMSDVAGSSGTRGHAGKRGSGIPIPGFELFQFAVSNPKIEEKSLARFTDLMFQNGYDFRFGITMSIPVMVNQALTTLLWGIRQKFCYHRTWKDIFFSIQSDGRLARMQLVSAGCFTLVDISDAALRSHGQLMLFALHLNYVGICKFAFAGYREICIRFNHAWSSVKMERAWNSLF